jgi:hypothetical protein
MNPKPSPSFTRQNVQGRTGPELESLGMIQYSDYPGATPGSLPRCQTGNKSWDYNSDGFAHYGMFPDMLQFLSQGRMSREVLSAFMNSAEYFARMWQKCELIGSGEMLQRMLEGIGGFVGNLAGLGNITPPSNP